MAASILNSKQAIQVSVFVVRAFIKLREIAFQNQELSRRLTELEKRFGIHDEQIKSILQALRQLMLPAEKTKSRIGFQLREKRATYSARG
jgi:hypothetical protein